MWPQYGRLGSSFIQHRNSEASLQFHVSIAHCPRSRTRDSRVSETEKVNALHQQIVRHILPSFLRSTAVQLEHIGTAFGLSGRDMMSLTHDASSDLARCVYFDGGGPATCPFNTTSNSVSPDATRILTRDGPSRPLIRRVPIFYPRL